MNFFNLTFTVLVGSPPHIHLHTLPTPSKAGIEFSVFDKNMVELGKMEMF